MGNLYPYAPFWSLGMLTNDPVPPQGEVVSLERIESHTGRLIEGESASTAEGRAFKPGDVLFGKLRPYLAKYWLSNSHGTAQGDIHVYRPADETEPRFLAYLVGSKDFVGMADTSSTGTKMPRVEWSKVAQFQVPKPPLETQRAIADYLDRETAEIDAMSADLDETEALLTERRSTSISQHLQAGSWAVAPIATMAEVALGKMIQPKQKDPTDTEAPYLRAAHVPAPGSLNLDVAPKSMWFTPGELDHLTLRTGDVVIVEGGAGYGRAALVSTDLDGWGFQNSIIRVRAHGETAIGKFITYALLHAQSKGAIELLVSTATLPHFTAEKVERFRLPFPPIDEQRRIADEIDRETAEIDAMLADITELRDLLAERRAAIIAAAVTGQIDIPIHEEATYA